jgi:hypothetical protein
VVLDREERVYSATIVEVVDVFYLDELKAEIEAFKAKEKSRLERGRDRAELERLQKKLGKP